MLLTMVHNFVITRIESVVKDLQNYKPPNVAILVIKKMLHLVAIIWDKDPNYPSLGRWTLENPKYKELSHLNKILIHVQVSSETTQIYLRQRFLKKWACLSRSPPNYSFPASSLIMLLIMTLMLTRKALSSPANVRFLESLKKDMLKNKMLL